MYQDFYGLTEKPFSLTPDPRFFYRSQSHGNALELVKHGISRHDGLVVVTGMSGIGKTTLCRTILEEVDRGTLTSLVLNPYISDEDLLRLILLDFGVISREENRLGRLSGVRTGALLQMLRDFLLSLRPLGARALVIVDEAQKLPLQILEQVGRLAALGSGHETLLQVVLVGQESLSDVLRAPELRSLDNRVQIRYRLRALTAGETAGYVRHRLAVAGDISPATFTPKALRRVHRATKGNARLINLVCDRALLGAFSAGVAQVGPDVVEKAASGLHLEPMGSAAAAVLGWMRRRVAAL